MIRWAGVALYLAATAMFGQSASAARIYSNSEYGIRFPVPKGRFFCWPAKTEHDHGFGILLGGGGAKDCRDDAHHRSIWLFAFGNVVDATKYLPGLLNMGCESAGGRCGRGPAGLEVPGLASATGRVDLKDSWIQIVVVTQAGEPSSMDPGVPSVNYIFSLRTRPKNLDEDLAVFQAILQTTKLFSSPAK
jgi:hypothetical protein